MKLKKFNVLLLNLVISSPICAGILPDSFCSDKYTERDLWTCELGNGLDCTEVNVVVDHVIDTGYSYDNITVYRLATASDNPADFIPAIESRDDTGNPFYIPTSDFKQIVIFSAGYPDVVDPLLNKYGTSVGKELFELETKNLWLEPAKVPSSSKLKNNWMKTQQNKLMYLTHWLRGNPIARQGAVFEAGYVWMPVREPAGIYRLWVNDRLVEAKVQSLDDFCTKLKPFAVTVVLDTEAAIRSGEIPGPKNVTDAASVPGLTKRPYGVARISNTKLNDDSTTIENDAWWIGPHELGHAALNLADEYIEIPFLNAHILDLLDPYLILMENGVRSPINLQYIDLSEILIGNGLDNISLQKYASDRNAHNWNSSVDYLQEGAYFEKGVFRFLDTNSPVNLAGERVNLMSHVSAGYETPELARVVDTAFNGFSGRLNDRIINAGPPSGSITTTDTTRVLLRDADKNHHFHPTQEYWVNVVWPEPCPSAENPADSCTQPQNNLTVKSTWITVTPTKIVLSLDSYPAIEALGKTVDDICNYINSYTIYDCYSAALTSGGFLPMTEAHIPYQSVEIPTPTVGQDYYWSFGTFNGKSYTAVTLPSKLTRQ